MKTMAERALEYAYKTGRDMMVVRGPHGEEMGFAASSKVAEGYAVIFRTDIATGEHKSFDVAQNLF